MHYQILSELCHCVSDDTADSVVQLCDVSSDLATHFLLGRIVDETAVALPTAGDGSVFLRWNISTVLRPMLIARLGALVGEKIFEGRLTFFPEDDEHPFSRSNTCGRLFASNLDRDLLAHLQTEVAVELRDNITELIHVLNYTASGDIIDYYHIFGIVHACLIIYRDSRLNFESSKQYSNILQVLIRSHITLSKAYDTSNIPGVDEIEALRDAEQLNYVVRLCSVAVVAISRVETSSLSGLPPELVDLSDREIVAAIRTRLRA